MKEIYRDLRMCIYSTEEELKRFRELIVDAVLATDIAENELQTLRRSRWTNAFSDQVKTDGPTPFLTKLKQTWETL
jgi:hypothetical protein